MVMCYKNLFTPCTFDLQLTIFLAVNGNLCSCHLSVAALSATYSVCYIDIIMLCLNMKIQRLLCALTRNCNKQLWTRASHPS